MKEYINKRIIGWDNLNRFFDSIKHLNIEDGDFTYDCEERNDDQSKNVYFIQYFKTIRT